MGIRGGTCVEFIQFIGERWEFLWGLTLEHIAISVIAIVIAMILGGGIGIIVSEFQQTTRPIMGSVSFLYTIPSISLLGFLIPLTGIGNTTAIVALSIYALLPMVRNTYTGLTQVDTAIIEAAKGLGSTRWQILSHIKIPLALPVILSGLRNMITMTIALAGIASFIGAGGLGVAIYRGITTNNAQLTLVGSLCIAVIALVSDVLFVYGEQVWKKKRVACEKSVKKKKHAITVTAIIGIIIAIYFSLFNPVKPQVKIATKPMTEQYILGEMLAILIETNTDLHVDITHGIGGGTANIHPAMIANEFDVYPEYTGTGWSTVLQEPGIYTNDQFTQLQNEYSKKYNMQWTGMYGFENSYALAVRKEIATQYDLETISDLRKVAEPLVFGAEYDFYEREDGYEPLIQRYNLTFYQTVDLDIGLKYQAIEEGKIDVMPIFTTDGQASQADIVVLSDDLQFYPSYTCGNVVRHEVLQSHPELQGIFDSVTQILTNETMSQLNYDVEKNGIEPHDVARNFLEQQNLLK